jgi:hypothetical protein
MAKIFEIFKKIKIKFLFEIHVKDILFLFYFHIWHVAKFG